MKRFTLSLALLTVALSFPFSASASITIPAQSFSSPGVSGSFNPAVFDLTQGDLTLSYTVDMTGITSVTPFLEVGIRQVGGGIFNPANGGWMVSHVGTLTQTGLLDLNDKNVLAKASGGAEPAYDATDPNTVVAPFGGSNNHGFWYDRNAASNAGPLDVNGDTYNTSGLYDISISYHALSPTLGTMFATINGITQEFSPFADHTSGLSFAGDLTQMQVFTGAFFGGSGTIGLGDVVADGVLESVVPEPTGTFVWGGLLTLAGLGCWWGREKNTPSRA